MKVRYNREMDIATIEISPKKIDYAKEAQNIIVHFCKDDEPVILEIMDASKVIDLDYIKKLEFIDLNSNNEGKKK